MTLMCFLKSSKNVPNDPVSVSKYVLKKDPDNHLAHLTLAVNPSPATDVTKAYENVLSLMPTDASMLAGYSKALLCDGQIGRARAVIDRASEWHPGHRDILTQQIFLARSSGEYDVALLSTKRLLEKGYITYKESYALNSLFSDLGHPELALPHIRFEPVKAHIYALLENKQAAFKEAAVYDRFYTSTKARMIADETYFPENYSVHKDYRKLGEPDHETKMNACGARTLMRDTYVLKKIKSEKYEHFLRFFTEFMEGKDVDDFRVERDYRHLMWTLR